MIFSIINYLLYILIKSSTFFMIRIKTTFGHKTRSDISYKIKYVCENRYCVCTESIVDIFIVFTFLSITMLNFFRLLFPSLENLFFHLFYVSPFLFFIPNFQTLFDETTYNKITCIYCLYCFQNCFISCIIRQYP